MWDPQFYQLSPLFNPLLPAIQKFQFKQTWPLLADYNNIVMQSEKVVAAASGKSILFVTQDKSSDFTSQYEPRIYLEGEVQTREDNWHDFFNMLVWLTFPRAKAILNKQQYTLLKNRIDISNKRSAAENFLTLFDENGLIVVSSNSELLDLIKNFRWKELFWQRREEVINEMRFFIFGHSLYEKGLNPYVGMTAKSILFTVPTDFIPRGLTRQLAAVDALTAQYLADDKNISSTRNLTPLPVLGIPGWSPDNNDLTYYQNLTYFRARRQKNI